jgi:hypothetical protein
VNDFSAPIPFGPTVRGIGYWFRRDISPAGKEQDDNVSNADSR